MKKQLIALLLAGVCVTPSLAQAETTPYVSANVGLGLAKDTDVTVPLGTLSDAITFKNGVPFGGAVGVKIDDFRFEAALGYQTHSVDTIAGFSADSSDKVSMFTYMVNAYFDDAYSKESRIIPYIMGGVGGATINPQGTNLDASSKSVLAWQLGGGIGVKASDHIMVDLGYRYLKPSDYTVNNARFGSARYTAAASNILFGVRYGF